MKFTQTEKNSLICDHSIQNHLCAGASDVVWIRKGIDLSFFPNAQMLYPAAGVVMAYLITRKGR